jgi:hypothetical protein
MAKDTARYLAVAVQAGVSRQRPYTEAVGGLTHGRVVHWGADESGAMQYGLWSFHDELLSVGIHNTILDNATQSSVAHWLLGRNERQCVDEPIR